MLLLGGPLHGQERELPNGQTELTIMAASKGNPLPMPWKYQVQYVQAETRPGMYFQRAVLVENNMPVEVATQALASILLQRFSEELLRQFMEGGMRIEPEPSDIGTNNGQTDSGILIAKR